jgi:glycosyltransferase involved in cell wall biosynthesis
MSWPPSRPIGLVSPMYAPAVGGVERYVERLAQGLLRRDLPVEIVATDPGASRPRLERHDGITVRRFPTVRGDRTYFVAPRLASWLAHHAADHALLHAHNLHTVVPLAAWWAARGRVPLVLTGHYHGTGHTPLRRALHVPYRPVAGVVARAAARVVCNSEAERDLLRRDFGGALAPELVVEGIDLPPAARAREPGEPDPDGVTGRVTLLSVGRIEAYKHVDAIVGALPHLPAAYRLVVCGDGPARERVEVAARAAGVADRVILRGRVSDDELGAWYAAASAAISLSSMESFGLVVLEAVAAGCPVVASGIGAFRELARFVPPDRITYVDERPRPHPPSNRRSHRAPSPPAGSCRPGMGSSTG